MEFQIGNLTVPKLFETWDNPRWVGEEADKYRNVIKGSSVEFADDVMSANDLAIWRSCDRWSVDEIYIKIKYGMWTEDMELQFIPEDKIWNIKKAKRKIRKEYKND